MTLEEKEEFLHFVHVIDKVRMFLLIFIILCLILLAIPSPADAATSGLDTDVLSGSAGSTFNQNLEQFYDSFLYIGKIISTIMVCLGGIMVATNMDSGNKLLWNAILGIGIVMNIGTGLLGPAFNSFIPATNSTNPMNFEFSFVADGNEVQWQSFFTDFLQKLHEYTQHGATVIEAPAAKLLLVFTAITATVKISLDLITGDKVRYLATLLLETGAFMFLITNWYNNGTSNLNIMESLMNGFEQLGYMAGGVTDNPQNDILGSGVQMFLGAAGHFDFDLFSPVSSLMQMVCLCAILVLLVLAGLEMIIARIEFWIMAMLTIPLIPFAALPQTKFLFEKALGCMMNLAIKVCVIAFIASMSTGILTQYVQYFKEDHADGISFPMLIQALLVSFLLFLLVKKIPQLVQGLLSGNPSLQGSNMREMAGNAAKAGTAIATGGAAVAKAGVAGAISGGFKAAGKESAHAGATKGGIALSGMAGAIGGGLNAAGGSLAKGIGGIIKDGLLGPAPRGGGSAATGGAGGGGMRSGGLFQPLREGNRMGQNFDTKQQDGSHSTLTGMVKNAGQSIKEHVWNGEQKRPDKDGNMQPTQPTGRHRGFKGNLTDMRDDALKAFDTGKTVEQEKMKKK